MSSNTPLSNSDIDSQETDPQETQEWLDALVAVIENEGTERAHFLLYKVFTC